ncbi:MAG: hypothetical protein JJ892_02945 [Balneola sp.]|nr:hypothetical protein [Balneola sp.]MBO6650161.1 hypothetical protein [Balneola sp.]MBO6710525.1 hypothetical protein [Balneola sp.]MBO6799210.1 hypothetical protein [Balneola sp.]MBO6871049.1 hypothetical protein [Balneola sp.]
MEKQSLSDIYSSLGSQYSSVFVVPKIRSNYPNSDYLYLLYKPLLNAAEYNIESVSVFGHYKFVFKALFSKKIILHYHWLEFQDAKSLIGMPWKLLCIYFFKLCGGKIIWTIHNLEPHSQKLLKLHLWLHTRMAKLADKVHIHSETAANLVHKKFNIPREKLCLHPHPEFPSRIIEREQSIDFLNSEFKWMLNPSRPITLIWGNIAQYKNIVQLLEITEKHRLDVQIVIAGAIKKGQESLAKKIEVITDNNPDFYMKPEFIQEKYIPYFFSAADFCLFNFDQILTSGSVEMALNYKKDVIAPRFGALTELNEAFLFSDEKELVTLIRSSIFTFYNE